MHNQTKAKQRSIYLNPMLAIRLQDIERIKSYLIQSGIEPNENKIALQHCKEVLGSINTDEIRDLYHIIDKLIFN